MSGRPSRKRPSPQVFGSSYTDSDYDDSPSKRHRSPLLPGVSIGGAFRPMRLPTRVYSPTANVSNTLPVLDHRLTVRNSSTFNTSAIRSSAVTPNADATQHGVDRSSAPWSSILGFPRFPPSSSPASRPPPASQSGPRNDFSPSGIGPFPPVSSQPRPVLLSSATLSAYPDSFPNPQARQHFTNTVDALKKSRAALEEILQGLPSYPLASGPLYKVIDAHNNLESWFISYAGSLAQNCACDDVEKEYFFADCKHRACAACLSKSGQCCKRNQSVFKAFFPQNDVCPICRDADNTMSILVCGHVVCRRCWDRMQRDTPLLSTTCPICRVKPAGPVASYEPSITVALDATP